MISKLGQSYIIPRLLIVAMLYMASFSGAQAAIVTSSDMVSAQQEQIERNQLLQLFERDDVVAAQVDQGVDIEAAKQRVESMTYAEVQMMNAEMDKLPAGAGFLEVALVVFLVLLFTDIMGYTDIFPFVKK